MVRRSLPRKSLAALATISLLVVATIPTPAGAAIRYVNASQPDDSGDGLTWPTAKKYLQSALVPAMAEDEIWVVRGTYTPDRGGGHAQGDRSARFELKNGVGCYGGFIGNELSANDRVVPIPSSNLTILSGDLIGDDSVNFPTLTNYAENSLNVVTSHGTNQTAILDGFMIRGGNGDTSPSRGAGMWSSNGHATMRNCTFAWNTCQSIAGGGAVYYDGGSAARLQSCVFFQNVASSGGAIVVESSNATFVICDFVGNQTQGRGGAARLNGSSPVFANCRFLANTAADIGGAAYTETFSPQPQFINCVFSGNQATKGGAIANVQGGRPTLRNCTLSGNQALNLGGGIYQNSEPTAVYLYNSILWANSDSTGTGETAQLHSDGGSAVVQVNYSCIEGLTGSFGGSGNIGSDPKFVDPDGPDNEVGTPDDNLRIAQCSSGVDSGDNAALPPDFADIDGDGNTAETLPVDLDQQTRQVDIPAVTDTGAGSSPIVDMGAYEADPTSVSVIYVNASATGANNGSSWTDAFVHLQLALSLAQNLVCSFSNVEIWVARGTYMPDGGYTRFGDPPAMHDNGTGLRSATFSLISRVAVYGGFEGGEVSLSQRDLIANPTILSGDLNHNDTTLILPPPGPPPGTWSDNSFHVVTSNDSGPAIKIDGFTIGHGNADGTGSTLNGRGGGLYVATGSPQVLNCSFVSNGAAWGGAVYNEVSTSPTFRSCIFTGNGAHSNSPPGGGAVFNSDSSSSQFIECYFAGNAVSATSSAGGAVADRGDTHTVYVSCGFFSNFSYGGGGIDIESTSVSRVENCVFDGNSAEGGQGRGGAIRIGNGADPTISNCTLHNNIASIVGGGVYCAPSSAPTISNSILWDNRDSGGDDLFRAQIAIESGANPLLAYNCIKRFDSPPPGSGNINNNPAFVNPGDFDGADNVFGTIDDGLKPAAFSPCIDAGDNSAIPADTSDVDSNGDTLENLPWDVARQSRRLEDGLVIDTGNGSPPIVDMGAYEFERTDCDGNGVPDLCDGNCAAPGCSQYPICGQMNDCNANALPDACDIASGFSLDCNANGIPDECDKAAPTVDSVWFTTMGTWNVTQNWCPDVVPNNDTLHGYRVLVSGAASVVTLDISPTVDRLRLNDGARIEVNDGSGANVRTLAVDEGIINNGVFRATDRERLVIDAPFIDQVYADPNCGLRPLDRGVLEAVDYAGAPPLGEENHKSILEINGSVVYGGRVRTIGTNSEIHLIGGAELVDVCVEGVVVPDGQAGGFAGTITNSGQLRIADQGAAFTVLAPVGANETLEGDGGGDDKVTLGGQTAARLGDFKSAFTNAANHKIDGAGIIFGGVTNLGTIEANRPGQHLIVFPPGLKTSNGTMRASGNGTLRIQDNVSGTGQFIAQDGTILIPGTTPVTVAGSTLDVRSGGLVQIGGSAQLQAAAHVHIRCFGGLRGCTPPVLSVVGSAGLTVGGDLEVTSEGTANLGGSSQTLVAQHVRLICSGMLRGCTPPVLYLSASPTLTVGGNIEFRDDVSVIVSSTATVRLAGNFDNQALESSRTAFDWDAGPLTMNGSAPQSFELAGEDFGPVDPTGFINNFAMGRLRVEPGRTVDFADGFDNIPASPCEVLYVDTLSLGAGSSITLHGCNVYYRNLINEGATVVLLNGAVLMSTSVEPMIAALLAGDCTPSPACLAWYDLNRDGLINAHDLTLLVRLLAGQ